MKNNLNGERPRASGLIEAVLLCCVRLEEIITSQRREISKELSKQPRGDVFLLQLCPSSYSVFDLIFFPSFSHLLLLLDDTHE